MTLQLLVLAHIILLIGEICCINYVNNYFMNYIRNLPVVGISDVVVIGLVVVVVRLVVVVVRLVVVVAGLVVVVVGLVVVGLDVVGLGVVGDGFEEVAVAEGGSSLGSMTTPDVGPVMFIHGLGKPLSSNQKINFIIPLHNSILN